MELTEKMRANLSKTLATLEAKIAKQITNQKRPSLSALDAIGRIEKILATSSKGN